MTVEIKQVDGGKGAAWTLRGTYSGDDLLQALETTFSRDLVAEPYYYGLIHGIEITSIDVSTAALEQAAKRCIAIAQIMPSFVLALCTEHALAYGLSRIFAAVVEKSGWTIGVFKERPEAVAWLRSEVAAKFKWPIGLD